MRIAITLIALLLSACAATPIKQPLATTEFRPERVQELNKLLEEHRFDYLIVTLVPEKFKPSLFNAIVNHNLNTDLIWLRPKAEEGYIPLLYVLAYRTLPKDPTEAMKLYARARTWAYLDAKECYLPSPNPWYSILEGSFSELNQARKQHPMLYLKGVDEALKLEASRTSRPSAAWYCVRGTDENLLPRNQAEAARKQEAQKLYEDNERKLKLGKEE